MDATKMFYRFGPYFAQVVQIYFQRLPHSHGSPRALNALKTYFCFGAFFHFSFQSKFSIAYLGYGSWPYGGAIFLPDVGFQRIR